jgi:hypothetical protein
MSKMGADDFLGKKTAERGEATADDLEGLPREEILSTSGYVIDRGRLCRVKQTKDGPVIEPLCNFTAWINEELALDDGAEPTRVFLIEGSLESGQPLPPARVPAARYNGMSWVTETWGSRAIVRAGQTTRDYTREAIQRLSPVVKIRHVFAHTGWRKISDQWAYLTATGAIGLDGCEVDLGPELGRYQLPRTLDDPVSAMRRSLSLLKVAPLRITAPLWAATFRAPLASLLHIDLSLWLEGQTGSLKSTLAALFLAHFGEFDRLHLPGTWSSTANQLERRAFLLKDVLFVIDDYAPSGVDLREMELKVSRLLRSQGNLAGRGRLRADLSERPAFAPRGLILSTGEQHPSGQSILARTLLIELGRPDIHLKLLQEAQNAANHLPHAMAGYIAWLAPQMPALASELKETFEGARDRATAAQEHLRVPEALAHLWVGLHCALAYAEDIGVCSTSEVEELEADCWDALLEAGTAQGQSIEEDRPSRRFLRVLLTLATQRHVVLLPKGGDDGARSRLDGDLVGWWDDNALFLLPEAAYQAVARRCRETGNAFPTNEDRLRRDLVKDRLSECDTGRTTKVVRIGEQSRRVIMLKRESVDALLGERFVVPLPRVTTVTGSEW